MDSSMQSSHEPPSTDMVQMNAEDIERMLSTVARIRGERDALRRDLEFIRMENKFSVQTLEKKLEEAHQLSASKQLADACTQAIGLERLQHWQRAAVISALVAQHLQAGQEDYEMQVSRLWDVLEEERLRVRHSDELANEREEAIRSMEAENVALREKLDASEESLTASQSQVQQFSARISTLEQEVEREKRSHEETAVSLSQTEVQLTDVTTSLENVESQRDSLSLQITHLEQDLEKANEQLDDAENRYKTLQSQQFSSLSSSEATRALRTQIQELEQRILRRTEQIGIHQHDIKRLETNLRLQEERITEMTGELDVAENEKEAMVEDCRTTREERDEAMKRCEELEVMMESLEERSSRAEVQRDVEVQAMVGVVFQGVTARRIASQGLVSSLARYAETDPHLQMQLREAEEFKTCVMCKIEHLTSENSELAKLAEERKTIAESLEEEKRSITNDAQQVTVALAAIESELRDSSAALNVARRDHISTQTQLEALRADLQSKADELTALREYYEAQLVRNAENTAHEHAEFSGKITELEEQCRLLNESNAELETRRQQVVEELARTSEELDMHASDDSERARAMQAIRDEMVLLRAQHSEEARRLREELAQVHADLEDAKRQQASLDDAHKQALEDMRLSKEELQAQLNEATEKLHAGKDVSDQLSQLQARYVSEVQILEDRLQRTSEQLAEVTKTREDLTEQHSNAFEELEGRLAEALSSLKAKEDLETEIVQLHDHHAEQIKDLEERLELATQEQKAAQQTYSSLQSRHEEISQEYANSREDFECSLARMTDDIGALQSELKVQADIHTRAQDEYAAKMKESLEQNEAAEAVQSQLRDELETICAQLKEADSSLQTLQEEKQELQVEMTNLGADIQRSLSLQRYQESQLKDSEREISSLREQLESVRTDYIQSEKAGKAAEINLSLQAVQHEKTVSSLRKELHALRGNSKLEETVTDLKEKNAEMEELLRAKCLEIEENDDRFIELLKEKKKLKSKIDSLTRKITNLQGKLTASSGSTPEVNPPPQRTTSSNAPPMPTFVPPPSNPTPSMPTYRPTTPNSRSRYASGSSALPRPKTPEHRIPPPPVFKARTPESKRAAPKSVPEFSMPSTSTTLPISTSVGIKRRAPDDFEDCESLPPQVFTADSAPSHDLAENMTPRIRKALHTVRSGFTPVRHVTRSNPGQSSPTRRATTGASLPAVIADVTNSPRGPSQVDSQAVKGAKRGWLGKMRGGSAHAAPTATRSVSLRPPVFERAQNGGSR